MSKTPAQRQREYRERHKALGLCRSCSRPVVPGSTRCRVCLDRVGSYKKSRRPGQCANCKQDAQIGNVCEKHWFMRRAWRLGWPGGRWGELRQLLEGQDYTCPLTGRELVPGDDTELDHIVPTARGGANELSNLQWVGRHANIAKNDMLPNEFAQFVADLHRHIPVGRHF